MRHSLKAIEVEGAIDAHPRLLVTMQTRDGAARSTSRYSHVAHFNHTAYAPRLLRARRVSIKACTRAACPARNRASKINLSSEGMKGMTPQMS